MIELVAKQRVDQRAVVCWLYGGLSLTLYLAITLRYPLWRYVTQPLLDVGKVERYDKTAGFTLVAAWAVLFLIYLRVLFLAPAGKVGSGLRDALVLLPLMFFLVQLGSHYILANDITDYIMRGRISSVYGQNPFAVLPTVFKDDPFFPFTNPQSYTATSYYGPVWEAVAAAVTKLAGNGLLANYLAFKLLAVAAYLGNGWLLYLLLRREQPQWVWRGLTFYLWNPLAVFEVAANAHNDPLMITPVLLALLVVSRGRERWRGPLASFWLAVGTLVKFLPLLLLPLFWLDGLRDRAASPLRRAQVLYLSVVVAASSLLLAYLPVWHGPQTLWLEKRAEIYTVSLPTALKSWFEQGGMQWRDAAHLVSGIATLLLALWLGYQMLRLWRGSTTLVGACFEVFFFYLLFCCLWFQPWYLLWLITLGALLPGWWVVARVVAFCALSMSIYAVWWLQIFFVRPNQYTYMDAEWLSIWLLYPLPLLLWFGWLLHEHWPGKQRTAGLVVEGDTG